MFKQILLPQDDQVNNQTFLLSYDLRRYRVYFVLSSSETKESTIFSSTAAPHDGTGHRKERHPGPSFTEV